MPAALIPGREIEPYSIQKGAMTGERIVEWMQGDLFPGRTVVVVMDNAQCHGVAVQACITESNFRFLETIPHSPRQTPLKEYSAK